MCDVLWGKVWFIFHFTNIKSLFSSTVAYFRCIIFQKPIYIIQFQAIFCISCSTAASKCFHMLWVKRHEKSVHYTHFTFSNLLSCRMYSNMTVKVNIHYGTNVRFCGCQCQWFIFHYCINGLHMLDGLLSGKRWG